MMKYVCRYVYMYDHVRLHCYIQGNEILEHRCRNTLQNQQTSVCVRIPIDRLHVRRYILHNMTAMITVHAMQYTFCVRTRVQFMFIYIMLCSIYIHYILTAAQHTSYE